MRIYIVLAAQVNPLKLEDNGVTVVGIQLPVHSFVYAVAPGVPSPKSAYLIFSLLGFCIQKSLVKNPHHCRLAEVGVKRCDAPQSIPIIANAKTAKA